MAEVQLGKLAEGQTIPKFKINIDADMFGPLKSPVIVHTSDTQIALDEDGRLVYNGQVVAGALAVDSWYTPFLTSDGHLRVRREDGQLEPYTGPDLVLEEVPVVRMCGRQESGDPDSTCVIVEHDGRVHTTADGRHWAEKDVPIAPGPAGTCKAALNIKGEHFRCDWQHTNPDGTHEGWAHTNKAAEAIWSN